MPDTSLIAAIIVAAGRGTRAGGPVPKQYQDLGGQPVLRRTVDAFRNHPRVDQIVAVIPPGDDAVVARLLGMEISLVPGGATRGESVLAGLQALPETIGKVLIHDGARPLIHRDVIDRVIDALADHPGAAPALPVTDALWHGRQGRVLAPHPRDGLWRAQTPQGFDRAAIIAAHQSHQGAAADDVEVALAAGLDVAIVAGDEANLKITHAPDFDRALALRGGGQMDIRTGTGYDVHRFGPGTAVWLCGVEVPHDRALQGHSDADVGLHAITDAIYGALAEGDIGRHFPPSDPQWKGAESHIFLRHAVDLAASKGYRISNIDCTLICERPKIGPHAAAMQQAIAQITGLAPDRISVKATTSERLGFTGREEGIAAMAATTLIAP
ncbi:bifunctional 2-C-methyl-D-erythritol 4-phosphate cytidylyltransferase/2-C-methyl-D-erythritol 2,4-cyclodiphosphate synthase [Actibacterium sp. 188UL27-1]|uniref:bifunctional 2-C-methyl-D-erythritol 4-phosphate cytidylyltransferase/2-C-methyl-D-erythritol 2,4-cyclodiphosphate synthase n=1 Tax=Actibacterium sp. 188UL27-1 TaxID=2786961 RepID=UPI0019571F80|nr:bifunctional 2-C-methyl-D-erythritol 4-phosphate cytidylyltransferase/2-C-methyl-D-erythritol 2,4-cyclodiphosphate synthase [Actibacterium sp. 188UL27-1]MBM7067832.1 bifunctional 2-C-methyl-D-erythritol 4-phosphate cytidylyltransferase/2-C-methyl-D-erythritol 2,4-cyclodiphosphate synthase [Actibacterium sp. 188UL27-1]